MNLNLIRVLIIDDHPIIRMGLRCCLERGGDINVVGEMGIVKEALGSVRDLLPDVILIGVKPPGRRGFELVRQIKRQYPLKIVVLSANNNRMLIQKMLSIGVEGIITKVDPPELIVKAIREVAHGQSGWFSREVMDRMSDLMQAEGKGSLGILTWRELEVLEAVVESKTNREISQLMNISEKTVEKHLEHIYYKLDVTSRVEAAVMAVRDRLVLKKPGKKAQLF
jgi:two-component system, NarL family, invasion response regulator UvrY